MGTGRRFPDIKWLMTLLPRPREFLAHSRNVVSKWQCRDPSEEPVRFSL
jgi:hypothetical protein